MAFMQLGDHKLSKADVGDLLDTDHPMVERFRFDKQREESGRSLDFALVILPRAGVRYYQQRDSRGRRVDPVARTLTGRERMGQGNRGMWVEQGEVMAANHSFFPNQEFNDLGIGSALYVSMERLYRQLGVNRVNLLAVDVGVYVWARQAFAFEAPDLAADLAGRLERFLFGHRLPCAVDEPSLRESWDLANYDADGHLVDGDLAGKAFMLACVSGWYGGKYLADPVHTAVAEQSRRETFARLPDKIEAASPDLRVR